MLNEHWIEVSGSYQALRGRLEVVGDLNAEYTTEVMDLDRAIAALRRKNPIAAIIVTLIRDGWTIEEVNTVLGDKLRTPPAKLLDKSTAFLAAFLSGRDADHAYRRGRRW